MRLVFSECRPDYDNYLFPYQVLVLLEDGEAPVDAFARGMLPSPDLTQYHLARSIRINLAAHTVTRRERYVRRRCAGIDHTLVPVEDFRWDAAWESLAEDYLAARIGLDRYSLRRLQGLLASPVVTHLLVLTEGRRRVGVCALYLADSIGYCPASFYDRRYLDVGIGNYMVGAVIEQCERRGDDFVYLGTCYTAGHLYKTRFRGMQFFNGAAWSSDRAELRAVLQGQDSRVEHLVEDPAYRARFCGPDGLPRAGEAEALVAAPGGAVRALERAGRS